MSETVQNNKPADKKVHKPNNIISIPVEIDIDFFKWWCVCLRPIINLTNKEIDVISHFLLHRYELSKVIYDQEVLDNQLMSNAVKQKIIEECNITLAHFYVVMSNLRKHNVITDYGINRKLIPNLREGEIFQDGIFQLLFLFKKGNKKQ